MRGIDTNDPALGIPRNPNRQLLDLAIPETCGGRFHALRKHHSDPKLQTRLKSLFFWYTGRCSLVHGGTPLCTIFSRDCVPPEISPISLSLLWFSPYSRTPCVRCRDEGGDGSDPPFRDTSSGTTRCPVYQATTRPAGGVAPVPRVPAGRLEKETPRSGAFAPENGIMRLAWRQVVLFVVGVGVSCWGVFSRPFPAPGDDPVLDLMAFHDPPFYLAVRIGYYAVPGIVTFGAGLLLSGAWRVPLGSPFPMTFPTKRKAWRRIPASLCSAAAARRACRRTQPSRHCGALPLEQRRFQITSLADLLHEVLTKHRAFGSPSR